jgi:hypothetical protein
MTAKRRTIKKAHTPGEALHCAPAQPVNVVSSALALRGPGLAYTVHADEASNAAIYMVSYIEVTPSSPGETMALLREYREASREEEW